MEIQIHSIAWLRGPQRPLLPGLLLIEVLLDGVREWVHLYEEQLPIGAVLTIIDEAALISAQDEINFTSCDELTPLHDEKQVFLRLSEKLTHVEL